MPPGRFDNIKATLEAKGAWAFCILVFITGLVVTPFVAPSIVAIVGFGRDGVIKGSWAAKKQTAIGDIEQDSPFSVAQSIGMGGGVPLYGIVAGGIILATLSMPAYFSIRYIFLSIVRWERATKNKQATGMDERKNDHEEMQNLKPGYFYAI